MTEREALKLALEALLWANEEINGWMDDAQGLDPVDHPEIMSAVFAIKEALAQPEQEPVAWMIWLHGFAGHFDHKQFAELEFDRRNKEYPDPDRKLLPLYTTPPQRTWVGLTDEEMQKASEGLTEYEWFIHGAFWAEAKLKEKNT